MMKYLRPSLSILAVLTGIALSAMFLYRGQPILALATVAGGIYVGITLLRGFVESLMAPEFQLAAGVIGVIGLLGSVQDSNLFDHKLQSGYARVLTGMAYLDMHCNPMPSDLRTIQEYGVAACAMQGNSDALRTVLDLNKGLYLGPTLSMVDSAATLGDDEQINHCARAYRAAQKLCPAAFSSVDKSERAALLEAAE